MAKKSVAKKAAPKKSDAKKSVVKKSTAKKSGLRSAKPKKARGTNVGPFETPALAIGSSSAVLDRLYAVIVARRDVDPAISHSARLLSRGTEKIAQKFGEEAVECLIEAVSGDQAALIAESADVLYHLMVMWVNAGVKAEEVWTELHRREGVSGIAEKAGRLSKLAHSFGTNTTKIP